MPCSHGAGRTTGRQARRSLTSWLRLPPSPRSAAASQPARAAAWGRGHCEQRRRPAQGAPGRRCRAGTPPWRQYSTVCAKSHECSPPSSTCCRSPVGNTTCMQGGERLGERAALVAVGGGGGGGGGGPQPCCQGAAQTFRLNGPSSVIQPGLAMGAGTGSKGGRGWPSAAPLLCSALGGSSAALSDRDAVLDRPEEQARPQAPMLPRQQAACRCAAAATAAAAGAAGCKQE